MIFIYRRVSVAGNRQPIPRDTLPAVSYKWLLNLALKRFQFRKRGKPIATLLIE